MATRATERANRPAANVERRVKIFSSTFRRDERAHGQSVWEKLARGHCPFSAAHSTRGQKLPETFGRPDFVLPRKAAAQTTRLVKETRGRWGLFAAHPSGSNPILLLQSLDELRSRGSCFTLVPSQSSSILFPGDGAW